jgi:3'-phosphoadenosine 5'-phosphosulfate sulfotransferase (PAPS reductase)/FAD synthetase
MPGQRFADFDLVIVNSSAGKDSQAMLTHLVEMADQQGYDRSRLVVVHADLGRVEWAGTRELVEEQAAAYGLRVEIVRRELGDLLDQIEARGMFPSSTARYCTSDQKTSQVAKLMTREVVAWRERTGETRAMRILNCLGIRAAESPARAKKAAFGVDVAASNGKRDVRRWLPIFDWSDDQVWAIIRRSGLPHHPAYDAGMPRLSCVFCVLAGKRELVLAARLNPALAAEYVAVEQRIGHTFRADLSMADIVATAATQAPRPAVDGEAQPELPGLDLDGRLF